MEHKELLLGLVPVTTKAQEIIPHKDYEIKQDGEKFYLVKKRKEYPKTYEECCGVLFEDASYAEFTFVPAKISSVDLSYRKGDFVTDLPSKVIPYKEKLNALYKLLICRDAYWHIAGEDMDLEKPWEPNWHDDEKKYTIEYYDGVIIKDVSLFENRILVFSTPEMRDAFYEAFEKEIEMCKELL